jgi:hypothetical protein
MMGSAKRHPSSKNIKWLRHFMFLDDLLGLFFNSQKCRHTFVNWYHYSLAASTNRKSRFKNVFSPVSVSTVARIKLVLVTSNFAI